MGRQAEEARLAKIAEEVAAAAAAEASGSPVAAPAAKKRRAAGPSKVLKTTETKGLVGASAAVTPSTGDEKDLAHSSIAGAMKGSSKKGRQMYEAAAHRHNGAVVQNAASAEKNYLGCTTGHLLFQFDTAAHEMAQLTQLAQYGVGSVAHFREGAAAAAAAAAEVAYAEANLAPPKKRPCLEKTRQLVLEMTLERTCDEDCSSFSKACFLVGGQPFKTTRTGHEYLKAMKKTKWGGVKSAGTTREADVLLRLHEAFGKAGASKFTSHV